MIQVYDSKRMLFILSISSSSYLIYCALFVCLFIYLYIFSLNFFTFCMRGKFSGDSCSWREVEHVALACYWLGTVATQVDQTIDKRFSSAQYIAIQWIYICIINISIYKERERYLYIRYILFNSPSRNEINQTVPITDRISASGQFSLAG